MIKKIAFAALGAACVVVGVLSAELSLRRPVAEAAVSAVEVERAPLSPLSQYQLIDAIETAELEAEDVAAELERIRREWQGRRYRWRGFVVGPLCARPDSCNVLIADRLGSDRDVLQGWMPRLHLSAEQHQRLALGCGDARRCEIRFEGAMSKLELSTDEFTRVEFDQVAVLEAEPAL